MRRVDVKVVVITGARQWADPEPIKEVLQGAEQLIVGDCPPAKSTRSSADALALAIARRWDVAIIVLAASPERAEFLRNRGVVVKVVSDWKREGNAAGPKRNRAIAVEATNARALGADVYCHAFPLPGSVGTHDCVRQLKKAGFEVAMHAARGPKRPPLQQQRMGDGYEIGDPQQPWPRASDIDLGR